MLMIYGAAGFTGNMVAYAAVAGGLQPILAGRSASTTALAHELGVASRCFSLDQPVSAGNLDGVTVLLNCAGPFSLTGPPLVNACLKQGVHYLDLAGEIPEHAYISSRDGDARQAGVALIPGVGFGIVPTDCAAAMADTAVDGAISLIIGYETRGQPSRGTLETVLPTLHLPGRQLIDGQLVATRGAAKQRIMGDHRRRVTLFTNPWRADVVAAAKSTRARTIETYANFPVAARLLMRIGGRALGGFIASQAIKRASAGPSAETRAKGGTTIWTIAQGSKRRAEIVLRGPEAYEFTARTAVECARLALHAVPAGYQTPSSAFGADIVGAVAGVSIETAVIPT